MAGEHVAVEDFRARAPAEAERLRMATAIEQADEMVMVVNPDGSIVDVNPAFERVTGYSKAEVVGRNPRFLKSGLQDDAFYRELWSTLAKRTTWRRRIVNRKKDGTLFTIDSTISPVVDAGGQVISYVAVNRDVTAGLRLEAQYLQAQKMEAVGRLAGGIAHDFNNVLSVIVSYAQMVEHDLRPEDPLRADMQEIRRAGLRAAGLTKQLLAFSRQQVLETRVVDLNQTLESMKNLLTQLLGADIALAIHAASDLWGVQVDPGQIEQVVMNLAVNARDAMPNGGALSLETTNVVLGEQDPRVSADVRPGPYVELRVRDNGCGIDEATQARIFEPFFTTKEKGKGTGLGLAMVFGVVHQSGGSIGVESEPGKGTTFKLYFAKSTGASEARPPSTGVAAHTTRGTETVLLVEDEPQVRALAQQILRRSGYTMLEAPNAGEALLICEQHVGEIHLLLTDVVMPRMSGRQLAERLLSLRPEMKVLFMSGYTDDTVLLHGIQEESVAFLQKPFETGSLTRHVRRVLDTPCPSGPGRAM